MHEKSLGVNLALNKSIIGSGTHDGDHDVLNLVDGLTTTRWSVSGFPQTAILDLGESYKLDRTEMVCYNDRDYQYSVSVSDTENGVYQQIVDRSENATEGSSANPIIDVFSDVEGRFIKLEITGAKTYTGSWMSLMEFRVFGDETLSIVDDYSLSDKIFLWPNPASNIVNISNSEDFLSRK